MIGSRQISTGAFVLFASALTAADASTTGWSSTPEGNLSVTSEIRRNSQDSLLWKWSFQSDPQQPKDTSGANYLVTPPKEFPKRMFYFDDNTLTFKSERPCEGGKDARGAGLSLWFYNERGASPEVLRLEILSGDKVVGKGWYYLMRTPDKWSHIGFPYERVSSNKITGFRLLAPTMGEPFWCTWSPCGICLSDVEFSAKNVTYDGVEIEPFEEAAVPDGWQSCSKGRLSVSQIRYKEGESSLLWTWREHGAELTYNGANFQQMIGKYPNLAFWVYNEKPSNDRLFLKLYRNGSEVGSFWYFMNFNGWQIFAAPYGMTKLGKNLNVDSLVFTAPGIQGRLWLDFINFGCYGYGAGGYRPATPCADDQQPWIGNAELLKTPESCLYSPSDPSINRPWLPSKIPANKITPEQMNGMDIITKKYTPAIAVQKKSGATFDTARLDGLENELRRWNIKRTEAGVTGRAISSRLNNIPDGYSLFSFCKIAEKATAAYLEARGIGDSPSADRLLDVCKKLLEHLMDQGQGSNSNNYFCYIPRDILKMREELKANGLYDRLVNAESFYRGKEMLYAKEPNGCLDVIHGDYMSLFPLLVLAEDPSTRMQNIQLLKRALDRICSRLDLAPFGADGTAFHHGLHHIDYAGYEIPSLITMIQNIGDAYLRASPDAYEILKKWTFTIAWSACKYTIPPNLPGRPGDIRTVNMGNMFAGRLTEMGSPDGKEKVDKDLASLFLALTDKHDSELAKKYIAMGITPYKFDGHRVLNGAATNLHRRDDWMVAMAGMNKNYGGLEIYGWKRDWYAQYARNGSAFVVSSGDPTSCGASGWSFEGWNYFHYPGATNPVLPAPQSIWRGCSGVNNTSAFAGGTDLDGDGIWGYEHSTEGIAFKKSAFCFGRRVTLITTDIKWNGKEGENGKHPLVTTLFQNSFAGEPSTEPCLVDGVEDKSFPSERTLEAGKGHWLIDNKGTGYYIHPGAAPLRLMRHPQSWTYMTKEYLLNKEDDPFIPNGRAGDGAFREKPIEANEKYYKPTTNNFALAYFEHGAKPEAPDCAYSLMVRSTPEEMTKLAAEMGNKTYGSYRTYEILQQDSNAHILWDRDTKTTGYAIFDAKWKFETGNLKLDMKGKKIGDGLTSHQVSSFKHQVSSNLLSVSRPCLVMLRESDGKLKLSVASTDYKDKSPMILTLNGSWAIESTDTKQACKVEAKDGSTTIEINYEFDKPTMSYMPIHAVLAKKNGKARK